jgi:hypothetical protein
MGTLAEAKITLVGVQDELQSRDARLAELDNALAIRADVTKRYDAYYAKNDAGEPVGDPYCLRCWEENHRLFHLVRGYRAGESATRCTVCGSSYDWNRAGFLGAGAA